LRSDFFLIFVVFSILVLWWLFINFDWCSLARDICFIIFWFLMWIDILGSISHYIIDDMIRYFWDDAFWDSYGITFLMGFGFFDYCLGDIIFFFILIADIDWFFLWDIWDFWLLFAIFGNMIFWFILRWMMDLYWGLDWIYDGGISGFMIFWLIWIFFWIWFGFIYIIFVIFLILLELEGYFDWDRMGIWMIWYLMGWDVYSMIDIVFWIGIRGMFYIFFRDMWLMIGFIIWWDVIIFYMDIVLFFWFYFCTDYLLDYDLILIFDDWIDFWMIICFFFLFDYIWCFLGFFLLRYLGEWYRGF